MGESVQKTSREIRQQFLEFFAGKEHEIVPSSPVVPHDDPTLMFANAGMNQFKDVFLATGSRPYVRAADTQKCIRAGGKHNDLDDVGQDTYHHTFFEMLGNWSFGDYFKAEAIEWAWELLTGVWGIDKSRLYATYFEGDESEGLEPDDEAAGLWRSKTDIDPTHIIPGNKKDNFWEMGETGPCGPCSEIHIDLTPDKSGGDLVNAGDHRVIEIWNLVFIQFNRDNSGKLTPLPAKHVDTGMGFERICAVLQHKSSNYDTDVWSPIFEAILKRTGASAYGGTLPESLGSRRCDSSANPQVIIDISYRVIADHLRCLTFALTDGAVPSNEGRGYVLRRILRRAVRYGRQYLNMHEPFMCDLVPALVEQMEDVFPELRQAHGGKNVEHVQEILRDEEESFGRTLDRGIRLFNDAAEFAVKHHHGRISGEDAFKLHDTYGFPVDLTELMAEERGLTVDIGEYERLMERARELARSGGGDAEDLSAAEALLRELNPATWDVPSSFSPTDDSPKYCSLECDASVLGWFDGNNVGKTTPGAEEGAVVALVLDRTCFYAEQGGQIGDVGTVETDTGCFEVEATQWGAQFVLHVGRVSKGRIEAGQSARVVVHRSSRKPTMKNHTATHVLNWALREVLGEGVQQKGSLVDAEKTRFDFSHNRPLASDEVARIEQLVNEKIDAGLPIDCKETELKAASEISTLRAVFGEKYADIVRVVSVGATVDDLLADPKNDKWMEYPVEFCGGTHLSNTSEMERFALVSEEGVAKGVRRVVGITGDVAKNAEVVGQTLLDLAKKAGSASGEELAGQLSELQKQMSEVVIPLRVRHQLQQEVAALQKKAKDAQKKDAAASGEAVMDQVAALFESAEVIGGVTVVVGEVPNAGPDALRGAIDWVRNKTDASAVLLAMGAEGKVTLIAGMSKDVVKRGVKAGDLIKEIAPVVGGRGGGRPDMAQGGGSNPEAIGEAVAAAKTWIAGKLS